MDDEERYLRGAMVRHGYSIFMRGLSKGDSGNMSLRLPDGTYLISPTGVSLGRLKAGNLSRLNANGTPFCGAPPTKEVFMHLACYAANPECQAVVHLHSPKATAFSCLTDLDPDDCLPPVTPYFAMRIGKLALVPYCRPGSPEIGEHIARVMPGRTAVLLANHGPVVCGKSLDDAVNNAEEIESAADLYFTLYGHSRRVLTPEERAELKAETTKN
jgi:ribulose-5-phosphate 4-epimerase/fuculose-1-phosphate aldolase